MRAGAALQAVFRLEAERVVQLAKLGREPGAEVALADIDAQLSAAMAQLDSAGVAYPLHSVGRQYGLSDAEYAILLLALLPQAGSQLAERAAELLGEPAPRLRMSHALALVAEGRDDWASARAELAEMPLFAERLVVLRDLEDGDAELQLSEALSELLGLAV